MAKEATEALEQASYNHRVQETEIWLAKVCRDYYKEVCTEALNRARVLTTSK